MTERASPITDTDRGAGGKFLQGHQIRGGRNPGPSRTERVALALEPHLPAVLQKAVELALLGDPAAMKLVLERAAPQPKQDAERVSIPGLAQATTVQGKADCIVAAVADGTVSVEAGERALSLLERYVRTVVADDHERRLQAIEVGRAAIKPAGVVDMSVDDLV